MDGVVQVLMPLILLCNGIAAGVLLWSVIGGAPLLLSLPARQYVEVHQFWGRRYDGLQPLLVTVTAVADAVMVIIAPNLAVRVLCGMAALAAAGVPVVSKARNVPLKRKVMSLDPANLPDNWTDLDPRQAWANWNLVRTVCGIAALVANVAAVGFLL